MSPDLTTPDRLGASMLATDRMYPRIAVADRAKLVALALQDGATLAEEIRARWGDDPDAIAARSGIPVIDSAEDADYGSTAVFAEYLEGPARIVLYRGAIARFAEAVEACGLVSLPCPVRSVLLAHELYHHFDCTGSQPPIARRHRVTLVAVGPWRWTSGIASLAEIAAGAFAQTLLHLPIHPHFLDRVMASTGAAANWS